MTNIKSSSAVGIIAEYNPFHNGHAYHIKKAKELAHAEYCIVIMSGDFVQRGAPAVYDKYTRTAMALSCGADLVVEMPSLFATSSAEDFAACGVTLLDKLGIADTLCFGSECGDVMKLNRIASVLEEEPLEYVQALRRELKKGASFPKARKEALVSCNILDQEEASILSSPNNILGIEYCKAIKKQGSNLSPLTITREGSSYHDPVLVNHQFSSATGIRTSLKEHQNKGTEKDSVLQHIPDSVKHLVENGYPIFSDDFSLLLNTALLTLSKAGIPFESYADISQELASRIARLLPDFLPFDEKIAGLKTRQYTYTRISRGMLHLILGMTSNQVTLAKEAGYAPYARVLGFKRASADILSQIKKRGSIPLITKTAHAESALTNTGASMLLQDFYCSHIYQSVLQNKYGISTKNEYTQSVVIL